ncbi:hypothetical protein DIPPA_24634 [Diplonema papillatum]|nr:hypothetical protein DIPPA_24634 [Diplonema papillatum]
MVDCDLVRLFPLGCLVASASAGDGGRRGGRVSNLAESCFFTITGDGMTVQSR